MEPKKRFFLKNHKLIDTKNILVVARGGGWEVDEMGEGDQKVLRIVGKKIMEYRSLFSELFLFSRFFWAD